MIDDEEVVRHLVQTMIKKEHRKQRILVKHYDVGFKEQPLDIEKCLQVPKRAIRLQLDLELRSRFAQKEIECCENLC